MHNWDAGSGAIHVLDVVSRDGVSFLIAEGNFVVIGRTWSDGKGLGLVLRNLMEGEEGQGFIVRDFGRLLFVLARLTRAAFISPC